MSFFISNIYRICGGDMTLHSVLPDCSFVVFWMYVSPYSEFNSTLKIGEFDAPKHWYIRNEAHSTWSQSEFVNIFLSAIYKHYFVKTAKIAENRQCAYSIGVHLSHVVHI